MSVTAKLLQCNLITHYHVPCGHRRKPAKPVKPAKTCQIYLQDIEEFIVKVKHVSVYCLCTSFQVTMDYNQLRPYAKLEKWKAKP